MNATHGKSGCWNTDFNAGTCLGVAKEAVWGWVEGVQTSECKNVNWQTWSHLIMAYSLGSTQ
jgi:hypothetical protein